MFEAALAGGANVYEHEELIKVFLRPSEYRISVSGEGFTGKGESMRRLYGELSRHTGKAPEWGILTGVRPVKLAGELHDRLGGAEAVRKALTEEYLLSGEKADLLLSVLRRQRSALGKPARGSGCLYIGIPFCPTRCLYCSFTSNKAEEPMMSGYMEALLKEMAYAGAEVRKSGMRLESVYIGGGTPTALPEAHFSRLLDGVTGHFDLTAAREFSVEAGRPDTITSGKLSAIKGAGVTRISINPQSMHGRTLEHIGRMHTRESVAEAFSAAREAGMNSINMDVIAGLPGEGPEDFAETLRQVVGMGPENITVHTLAVKRASRLMEMDSGYHYGQGDAVREMLQGCGKSLAGAGYAPYYLYRQKHMAGGLENVGWCREGAEGVYNVRIMEEAQTVVALGAGGISKVFFPDENRHERVPNVSDCGQYVSRIDEMIARKREKLFTEERERC